MNPQNTLDEIRSEIAQCHRCSLADGRKRTVPGEGPTNADIMFIGEGPGFYENEQGKPFVGQAGKFLDELLATAGYERENVFITNVVKCRPPGNRDPQPEELTACANYLDRQIAIIQPKVIVTLGRHSMGKYFTNAKISLIHGRAAWVNGQLVVAMYHPAAGLHQPNLKSTILADFRKLPEIIEQAKKSENIQKISRQIEEETPEDDATQLSFF
ncbi:MAG TPA: uracil-DNA glycosylase [Anaerolineaceae bacterium]|uniref:Type-4 uracil-DNA glycosylase n=1 Tax=Anaerolinea thermophila TaxID=167964 RepID=A0A117LGV7_9CHLR|nr:MAG: Uracil-DNA glycosylase [Anaerolinea thermophila]HAF61115.1 uracil-DNA glycosylase [Anaerolineaceae bacterium]